MVPSIYQIHVYVYVCTKHLDNTLSIDKYIYVDTLTLRSLSVQGR